MPQSRQAGTPVAPSEYSALLQLAAEHLSALHHELDISKFLDVFQRIARDRNHVRVSTRRKHANLSAHVEHLSRARGRALDGSHRRHSQLSHLGKFLRERFCPRDPSHVGPEDDLYPCLQCLLERLFMDGGAPAVALAV